MAIRDPFSTFGGGRGISTAAPNAAGNVYTVSGLKVGSTAILYANGTQVATATVDSASKATRTLGSAPAAGTIMTYDGTVSGSAGTAKGGPVAISGTPGTATVGMAYSFAPTVLGGSGTKTFSLSGTLPAGLSFLSSTGAIIGTPTAGGAFSGISITVMDSGGTSATLGPFTLTVSAVVFAAPTATKLSAKTFRPGGTTGGAGITHATIGVSDAPFTGGVLQIYNTTSTAQTVSSAAVAASAVENDGYNPLDGSGAAGTWIDVAGGPWTVPAAPTPGTNGVPGVLSIPFTVTSIPRTDNAAWPHILMSRLRGVTALTPASPSATEQNNQAAAFNGKRPHKGFWKSGDFVTNKAGFTAPAQAYIAVLDVIFTTTVPGKTVLFAGDSTEQGASSTSNYLSWGLLACDSLSTLAKPVFGVNCGFQGQTLAQSIASARAFVAAMSPQVVCIPVWSVNDSSATQAIADVAYASALQFADDCAASGITPILVTGLPSSSLSLASDNIRKTCNANARANPKGYKVFDYAAVFGDGASPERLNASAASSDGTHPTTYAPAATAFATQHGPFLTA